MQRFERTEYAFDIYSEKNIWRVATQKMEIGGYVYEPLAFSPESTNSRIDIAGFQTSLNEMEISIYVGLKPEAMFSVFGGSRVKIMEFVPDRTVVTYNETNNSFQVNYVKQEDFAKYSYEARVSNVEIEDNLSCKLTITFDKSDLFSYENLKTFNRNTFARYYTINPSIVKTEEYIPIASLNEDACNPIGPISGFKLAGDNPFRPRINFASFNNITDTDNKLRLTPSLLRESASWENGSTDIYPGGRFQIFVSKKYVDALQYTNDNFVNTPNNFYRGQQIFNGKRDRLFGEVTYYNEDVNGTSYRNVAEITTEESQVLIAYRGSYKDTDLQGANLAEQLREYITTIESEGKLLPIAFKFHKMYVVTEGYRVARQDRFSIDYTVSPPDVGAMYTLQDTINSFYVFEVDGLVDLRTLYAFRAPNTEMANDDLTETDPGQSRTYKENNMFIQSYANPGTYEQRVQLFDEQFIKVFDEAESNEADKGLDISANKWFLGSVLPIKVVKEVAFDFRAIKDLDFRTLINTRADVISTNRSRIGQVRILDNTDTVAPGSAVDDIEMKYEDIFSTVDGRFGFIEDIRVDESSPNRVIASFYTSRQWDSDTATPSYPNVLTIDDEDRGPIKSLLITTRPVPENAAKEGEVFPIVYGHVKKFPAIQAVSKKANFGDPSSAGDDIYVLCSNPISRKDGNGVLVYWGLDEFANGASVLSAPGSEVSVFQSGLDKAKKHWLQNPLPRVGKVPTKWINYDTVDIAGFEDRHRLPDPVVEYEIIAHPFHNFVEIEGNDQHAYSAIQLRGDEYIPTLGEADPRHAIRFGLGSSQIYCSFTGMPDNAAGEITGIPYAPILNPAHILKHFILHYSNIPNIRNKIDHESFEYAFQKTKDLFLGAYINESPVSVDEFTRKIAECSFVYLIHNKGKYKAKYLDLDPMSSADFIFNDWDITSIETNTFFEGVTSYNFQWEYDFPTNKYAKSLVVSAKDNEFISKARNYVSEERNESVELSYVFDDSTAKRLVDKYIKLKSGFRTELGITIVNNSKLRRPIEEFDIIELTSSRGFDYVRDQQGFQRERFIVTEVKYNPDNTEIKAVQLEARNQIMNHRYKKNEYSRIMISPPSPEPQPVERLWTPLDMEEGALLAWFNPNTVGRMTLDGDLVETWQDETETYTLVNDGVNRRPRIHYNAAFGNNYVDFAEGRTNQATRKVMSFTPFIPARALCFEYFVSAEVSNGFLPVINTKILPVSGLYFFYSIPSGSQPTFTYDADEVSISNPNRPVPFNPPLEWNSAGFYDISDNVITTGNGSYSPGLTMLSKLPFEKLGRNASPASACYHGDLVFANEISLSEYQKIEGFLAWKWGRQSRLPISHPYRNEPPKVTEWV